MGAERASRLVNGVVEDFRQVAIGVATVGPPIEAGDGPGLGLRRVEVLSVLAGALVELEGGELGDVLSGAGNKQGLVSGTTEGGRIGGKETDKSFSKAAVVQAASCWLMAACQW